MSKEIPGIYNWATHEGPTTPVRSPRLKVDIDDETLRDGLQGVQLESHPTEGKKIYLLNVAPFIDHADIGYPGSSDFHRQEVGELINLAIAKRLSITLSAAAGAAAPQEAMDPIIDLSRQFGGYPIEADIFWDASKYRAEVQKWDRDQMMKQVRENIDHLKKNGLPVMFVPERATDTPPEALREVMLMAADMGVDRICIADTRGIAAEKAVRNILRFSFDEIGRQYPDVKWDLHPHNDRSLANANCLVAAEEGIDRVHATTFCLGERAGNADLMIVSVNLNEEGYRTDNNLDKIAHFAELASDVLNYPIPQNTPIYGADAFATASGIHASAVNMEQLGEREHVLYFAVPPSSVGRTPRVEVGPFSGKSNVVFKLRELGIPETPEIIEELLNAAKHGRGLLSNATIKGIAQRYLENGNGTNHNK